jgi:hypothetical protein
MFFLVCFQKYVLRSYDNRAWPCIRSPRVYKNWEKLKTTMIPIILVQDDDESNTLDFGVALDGDEADEKTMLFSKWNGSKGGKVEIIAVPYQEGSHECTSIIHVLSLLLYLKEMHDAGYVHGDVRGFNIVFFDVPEELDVTDFLQTIKSQEDLGTREVDANADEKEQKVAASDGKVAKNPAKVAVQVAGTQQGDTIDKPSRSDDSPVLDKDPQLAKIPQEEEPGRDSERKKQHYADMTNYFEHLDAANNPNVSIIPEKFKYACLIDFDFGGHVSVDKPIYPPRYCSFLSDGNRWQSRAGCTILPTHDVAATTNVLGCLHDIVRNISVAAEIIWNRELSDKDDLLQVIDVASKLMKICPKKAVYPKRRYVKCLHPDDDLVE